MCLRIDAGRPIAHVAAEAGLSRRCLAKWYAPGKHHVQRVPEAERAVADGQDRGAACPGERSPGPVTPDLVLFVNGLPWAVVECKAPLTSGSDSRAALDAAVAQVIGYAGVYAAAPVAAFTRFAQVEPWCSPL